MTIVPPPRWQNNLSTPPNRWEIIVGHRFHLSFPGLGSFEGSEGSRFSHRIPQVSDGIGNHPNARLQPSTIVRWRLSPKIFRGSPSGFPVPSRSLVAHKFRHCTSASKGLGYRSHTVEIVICDSVYPQYARSSICSSRCAVASLNPTPPAPRAPPEGLHSAQGRSALRSGLQ